MLGETLLCVESRPAGAGCDIVCIAIGSPGCLVCPLNCTMSEKICSAGFMRHMGDLGSLCVVQGA